MTQDRTLPTRPSYALAWRQFTVDRRRTLRWLARDVALPTLVFLAPLLIIVLIQCQTFGCNLFLGWDSSTYAWWAVLVQEKGALTMVLQWNYPHLYVLLLSAFGSAIGSVSVAEHILPLLVSVPLGYSYYVLTMRLTSDRRLGLFSAFLGGISMATIEMVSDLQRNLLAFGVALPLGASIYWSFFVQTAKPKHVRYRALAIWLPFLFVVLATQVETYAVLSIALLLAFIASLKWSTFLRGMFLLIVPILLAIPVMIGYLLRYSTETSKLLPLGPSAEISWTWLYLSGFAIPLIGVGIVSLIRSAMNRNPIARYLSFWLFALVLLVPAAIVIHVPPTRLLFMVPTPVLLALAVPYVRLWVTSGWKSLREHGAWIGPSRSRLDANPGIAASSPDIKRWSLGLLVAFIIVATPVVLNTALNKDQFRPFINEADAVRLGDAGALVRQDGYRDAIIILYGERAAFYAPIYRAYFGLQVPDNLAYYGKLQFLYGLVDPMDVYVWRFNPAVETRYSANFRDEILTTIGAGGIPARPIVIAGGATYTAALSEIFLSRFERAPGIYIIPPGALTARDIDTWRLYAAADCFVCGQGSPNATEWSYAPTVLEYVNLSKSAAFDASYVLSLLQGWTNANLTIRFWDWPAALTSTSGASVALAPLEVYLDGRMVLNHQYADLGALNLSVPTGSLGPGIHRILVRSTSSDLGVAVQLDQLELAPSA